MAKQTLTSSWAKFERLVRKYEKSERQDEKTLNQLEEHAKKVNSSKIPEALSETFVRPYDLEDVDIRFVVSNNGKLPDWKVCYREEDGEIDISVVGVFAFINRCSQAAESLHTAEARQSFTHYRYEAYLAELSKLPSSMALVLLILYEVASVKHITDVKKKSGDIESAPGEEYLKLLWAFKELESYYDANHGRDMRTEYGISWLESDWFIGE